MCEDIEANGEASNKKPSLLLRKQLPRSPQAMALEGRASDSAAAAFVDDIGHTSGEEKGKHRSRANTPSASLGARPRSSDRTGSAGSSGQGAGGNAGKRISREAPSSGGMSSATADYHSDVFRIFRSKDSATDPPVPFVEVSVLVRGCVTQSRRSETPRLWRLF